MVTSSPPLLSCLRFPAAVMGNIVKHLDPHHKDDIQPCGSVVQHIGRPYSSVVGGGGTHGVNHRT
jgi:hypothetical protein